MDQEPGSRGHRPTAPPQTADAALRRLARGFGSDVFATDDGWVVRVPRSAAARARQEREARLLALLSKRLAGVRLPRARLLPASDRWPLGASTHPYIAGRAVTVGDGAGAAADALARALARFLAALHAVPTASLGVVGLGAWPPSASSLGALRRAVEGHVAGSAGKPAAERVVRALDRAEAALARAASEPPVLVHGDLWFGNLIVAGGRLVAVIDFEAAALGPPAADLAVQRYLGAAFHDRVAYEYGRLTGRVADPQLEACLLLVREAEGLADGVRAGAPDRDAVGKVVRAARAAAQSWLAATAERRS